MRRATCALVAVLLALSACGEARDTATDVVSGAGKIRDCAALAKDAVQARLDDATKIDARDVQRAVDRLADRVGEIDDAQVRSAAARLRRALERTAEAARQGDTTALDAARRQVIEATRAVALACDLPVDRFTG